VTSSAQLLAIIGANDYLKGRVSSKSNNSDSIILCMSFGTSKVERCIFESYKMYVTRGN
jgi:hypothetical protein